MTTRKQITKYYGVYFITFTCFRWMPLFEEGNAYYAVYKWFNFLQARHHYILAYVIMPNHMHVLFAFRNTQNQSINSIVSAGKRFMAYEIVKSLKKAGKDDRLSTMKKAVSKPERRKGKLHEVFEPSFDWKDCQTDKFTLQKLIYIHENPCKGKWNLATSPESYKHSSAGFYFDGRRGECEVAHYTTIQDIDLTVAWIDE